jgi:hypothetical protein
VIKLPSAARLPQKVPIYKPNFSSSTVSSPTPKPRSYPRT